MKKIIAILIVFSSIWMVYYSFQPDSQYKSNLDELRKEFGKKSIPGVDHSKLEILQQEFDSPQAVSKACATCHTERHKEVMASSHWNWEREETIPGRGVVKLGKKNGINNFCIGINGSEAACTVCHAGFGYKDKNFDFSNEENVDCMMCHDNTGTYKKAKAKAGYPKESVDLALVAQSSGSPKKLNCGLCHFLGGGGNNVKHGDLETALLSCDRTVDVHMAKDGLDMECIACHETENHKISGKMYSVSSMDKDRATCEQCHGEAPHADDVTNLHMTKVACQTCHIPHYAKGNATKLTWDWSKTCKVQDPNYVEEDENGNHSYLAKKGEFTWATNVVPEYRWFNGTADHYLLGDKVDTLEPIKINTLLGSYADKKSKIIPVKIHRAKQIYDPVTKMLVQPKLWDAEKGKGALWVDCKVIPKDSIWGIAAKAGMDYLGLPYSGQYTFAKTEMSWPINHMVAEKENTLKCQDCHTRDDGRLADLKGFYMPGRDYNAALDIIGLLMIIGTFGGVMLHGSLRIMAWRKRKKIAEGGE